MWSCYDAFNEACSFCADFAGCCQCIPTNDFMLAQDDDTNVWYCTPQQCLDDDNNCRVCNN